LPKGEGVDHGEREPKRGFGAEPPAGSRGRALGVGQGAKPPKAVSPPEAESFLSVFIQKSGQKLRI